METSTIVENTTCDFIDTNDTKEKREYRQRLRLEAEIIDNEYTKLIRQVKLLSKLYPSSTFPIVLNYIKERQYDFNNRVFRSNLDCSKYFIQVESMVVSDIKKSITETRKRMKVN